MRKIIVLLLVCGCIAGCSANKKPPLQPSQVVNGRSIVVPPEFHTIPTRPTNDEIAVQTTE